MRPFLNLSIALLTACATTSPTPPQSMTRTTAATSKVMDASGYLYDPNDRSCDGFPRLQVETMPGTCLGLVLPRARAVDKLTNKPLAMPRTILELRETPGEFLLVDMGGWKPNNGGIYHLRRHGADFETVGVKTGLNMPHALTYGPDGFIYVGETDKVSRFHFSTGRITDWQLVINEIPRFKGYMHPLTQIAFDYATGDMYLNAGAPSDHCSVKQYGTDGDSKDKYVECPDTFEAGLGAIFKYPAKAFQNIPSGGIVLREVAATGLRNSMAMVVSPQHFLIQGENGRDFPQLDEPYEEINVLTPQDKGRFYGWPQCYDFHATSPEWAYNDNDPNGLKRRFGSTVDCANTSYHSDRNNYEPPWALIPPHAAPLHADYYHGSMFPALAGRLLMTWHGYQPTGHRLVAYNVDAFGRPIRNKPDDQATYMFDSPGHCPVAKKFAPRGGLVRYAPYTELISGWDERKGLRPKGAPVGFTIAHDGSIYLVEDRDNHTVVRLARDPGGNGGAADCAKEEADAPDPRLQLLTWRHALVNDPSLIPGYEAVRARLVTPYCIGCHGGMKATDIADDRFATLDFLVKNSFFTPGRSAQSKMTLAVAQSGQYPPMPPGGSPQLLDRPEAAEVQRELRDWIDKLPTGVEQTAVKINIGSARSLRNKPGNSGMQCGSLPAGAPVYVDPRPAVRPTIDGWIWTPAYFVPGDTNLLQGKCAYPEDGVYYMPLKKVR